MVNVSLRKLTEEYFASRLTHDAEGLLAGIVFDPDQRPVVAVDRADPIFNRPFSGHYYEVMSEGFVVRSRSLLDHLLGCKAGSGRSIYPDANPWSGTPTLDYAGGGL